MCNKKIVAVSRPCAWGAPPGNLPRRSVVPKTVPNTGDVVIHTQMGRRRICGDEQC